MRFVNFRNGGITTIGHNMVLFPLSPCLSRILLASLEFNCVESILIIAAMLSVEDVFLRQGDRKKFSKASKVWAELAASAGGNNDFFTLLCVFEECFKRYVRFQEVFFGVGVGGG
jgi:HrpA-like RNA helicase